MSSVNKENRHSPILVVGLNRSGTTWLCNILCNHPEVAGVQHELHHGIIESNMLGVMQTRFDLSKPGDYEKLIELWATTDYFREAGGDSEYFLELSPRPDNILRLFEILMDRFAEAQGKQAWVQKVQPGFALEAMSYFGNARVVVINRDVMEILKSGIIMNRAEGIEEPLPLTVYSHALQLDIVKRISGMPGVCALDFEKLKSDPEREIKKACGALELDFYPEMLEVRFKKNTSFKSDRDRQAALSGAELKKIKLAMSAARAVPAPALKLIAGIKNTLVPRDRATPLILGTFNIRDKDQEK